MGEVVGAFTYTQTFAGAVTPNVLLWVFTGAGWNQRHYPVGHTKARWDNSLTNTTQLRQSLRFFSPGVRWF
ncbi:hypothetical protein Pmani_027719 [Petrolisthes manimaculis]|uniref:Uncharacterized protein n=1 Tax=Petrolisthes manimaculis TaxID=1843537 RepID=A0AAE1P234_9EUCA|nr:hypothetical protein Pmani_027719 [Petrolisthes manimaculis]